MTSHQVDVEEVIWGRKQFRAPFKVHLVQWNPVLELLAIGSKKGEVVVKRPGWKKCWKTSVSTVVENPKLTAPTDPRQMCSLTWNPQGNVLAVGMDDGHYHLIDVDSGLVRWTGRLSPKDGLHPEILNLRWQAPKHENKFIKEKLNMYGSEEEEKALAMVEDNSEAVAEMHAFESIFYSSLQQTFLLALRNDNIISILAGGIVCVSLVDLNQVCEKIKMHPMLIHDALLSPEADSITIALEAYGPKPDKTGAPGTGAAGLHAQVISVGLRFDEPYPMWRLVLTYLRTLLRFRLVTTISEGIFKDWSTASQIFMNRINPSEGKFNFLDAIVTSLLSGLHTQHEEALLDKQLSNGILGMREFLSLNFTEFLKSINGPLTSVIRCFAHQLEKFQTQLNMSKKLPIESLLFPERNNDVNVYPFNCRENLSPKKSSISKDSDDAIDSTDMYSISEQLVIKVKEASIAGTANLRELQTLVRWLSLFPVVMKINMTKSVIHQSKKIENTKLWKYMLETFVEDGENKNYYLRTAFNLESVLEEMAKDEQKNVYGDEPTSVNCFILDYNKDEGEKPTNKKIAKSSDQLSSSESSISPQSNSDEEMVTSPTPKFQPFIDKVSEFWGNELSDATLELIYSGAGYNRLRNYPRKATLSTLYDTARKALESKHNCLSQFGQTMSINWVEVTEAAPGHSEFNKMHLSFQDVNSILPMSDKLLTPRIGISVVAYNMQKCCMRTIVDSSTPNNPFEVHGKIELNLGDTIVESTVGTPDSMALTIATHKDINMNETIMEIVSACHDLNGNFYALVTGANMMLGTGVRRFMKVQVGEMKWKTHLESYRTNQLENICLSIDGCRGCSLSDEQTKIALFSNYDPADCFRD